MTTESISTMEMRLNVLEGNKLIMKNGPNFEVDFIVASIGIDLNTELAIEAGLSYRSD